MNGSGSNRHGVMGSAAESAAWDDEYRAGRYVNDPPVPFVYDILRAARRHSLLASPALYVGCGNGRNLLPLIAGGLRNLKGLDISSEAIRQLRTRSSGWELDLAVGDIASLGETEFFQCLVGIQVFQHGTRDTVMNQIGMAQRRVLKGGLMCVRVNSSATDICRPHEVLDLGPDGTGIRYLDGPKAGLPIYFFSDTGLSQLFSDAFEVVLPVRPQSTPRVGSPGQWTQWEGIWRRRE